MATKGLKPDEIIDNIGKQTDNEGYDFSSDSENEDEQNQEVKEEVDIESDSEMEFIAKSFNEDQNLNELMKNGIQRLRKFMESNCRKSSKKNNTFLNKKRKHEN
jgi:hypothetical protein